MSKIRLRAPTKLRTRRGKLSNFRCAVINISVKVSLDSCGFSTKL